ncbi:MAG: PQQ-binding-like beta-propeller repeat protein, partial [Planctomycetes bacterium]|nr:PQQ-binding-like beta-propeller repeat protein [Planctomycetota bacterium]
PPCPALRSPATADGFGDPLPPGAIRRFGTIRLRHRREVTAVDISPDGREIWAASEDGEIVAWDFATGRELRRRASWGAVTAIERLPGAAGLVTSGGLDAVFIVRDPATAAPRLRLIAARPPKTNSSTVHAFAASPDGRLWATAGAGSDVQLWDGGSGAPSLVLSGSAAPAAALAFPAAGRVAALARTGEWTLWEATSGAKLGETRLFERESGSPATSSPDGRWFAAHGSVWDASTGKAVSRLRGGDRRYRFSADGRRLAGAGTEIVVLDTATGAVLLHCPVPGGGYGTAVALSADGCRLVCGTHRGVLVRLRVETGPETSSLDAPEGEILSIAFTRDGRRLLAASERDSVLRAFDVESGDIAWKRPLETWPAALATHPGNTATVVLARGTVVLDDATGAELRRIPTPGTRSPPPSLTRDGKFAAIAVASEGPGMLRPTAGIEIWDLTSGEVRASIGPPGEDLESLALSEDASILAGTLGHHTLVVWDAATGAERARAPVPTRLTYRSIALFTPRGGLSLYGGSYDARTMTAGDLQVGLASHSPVFPGQNPYSPDGLLRASVAWGDGSVVKVTGVAPNALPLRHPGGRTTALAWAPDGRVLATGTSDGAIHLWDVRHPALLRTDPTTPPTPPAEQKSDGPPVLQLDFDDGFRGPGILDTLVAASSGSLRFVAGVRGSALRVEAGPDSRPLVFPEGRDAALPGPWTVEFWFRIEEGSAWVFEKPESGTEYAFVLVVKSDLFSFDVRQAMQPNLFYHFWNIYGEVGGHGSFDLSTPRGPIPPGRWTHVALAFETPGHSLSLYLDGSHASTTHHGSVSPPRVGELSFGSWPVKSHPRAVSLDELRIFDYARTALQISADAAKR